MAIHEKSLIRPENLQVRENVVVDGVDVSGHWSTFIQSRVVTDYNEALEEEIAALPGGEHIHRCWQCGSCTNSCTVNAVNPDFNPRFWIYLIRMGMESELLRDKDIIWQCVSCNKCTNICPKDVKPEGVMKALQHWMEDEGHVQKSDSTKFDEEFTRQCLERGRIEDTEVIQNFFKKTGQDLVQLVKTGWLGIMVARMNKWPLLREGRIGAFLARMPIAGPLQMGLAMVFKPRTKSWGRTGEVLRQYVEEQKAKAGTHGTGTHGAGTH